MEAKSSWRSVNLWHAELVHLHSVGDLSNQEKPNELAAASLHADFQVANLCLVQEDIPVRLCKRDERIK